MKTIKNILASFVFIIIILTFILEISACNKIEILENTEVYGTITDTAGASLEGVLVSLNRAHIITGLGFRPNSSIVKTVKTDKYGNYRLKFFYRKDYFIDFYKVNYVYEFTHGNTRINFNKGDRLKADIVMEP